MNSNIRLILDSRNGLRDMTFCSVNMALLARFWITLVISINACLTPGASSPFGCIDDVGIEIAGPINRRKTILPTPM